MSFAKTMDFTEVTTKELIVSVIIARLGIRNRSVWAVCVSQLVGQTISIRSEMNSRIFICR